MNKKLKELLDRLKLNVSKRNLLLIAAMFWALASGILISKGALWVFLRTNDHGFRIIPTILFGILFYRVLFIRISKRHIDRILSLEMDNPFILCFFNGRGYLMMAGMIALGVVLRNLDFINKDLLYTFYIGMGIPLLISAFRFYYAWALYPSGKTSDSRNRIIR